MFVVKAGAEFEQLSKIENAEEIFATPAFMDGRIYLRTAERLYCIEESDQAGVAQLWVPEWEELEKNWPSFRGPASNGHAFFDTAPTEWNVEDGTNVKWKVELGLPGTNSPVVWDNKVFISAADETTREVQCYDTETGEQLWVTKTRERRRQPGRRAGSDR